MKIKHVVLITIILLVASSSAMAAGKLNIFNWAGYTPPDVVELFKEKTGIEVTIDTYDTNEALLAKLKAGGVGYDIIISGHNFVQLMKNEGLIQRIGLSGLENYKNIKDEFIKPSYDPDGDYFSPYQGGTTSFMVDREFYKGQIDSYKVLFDPPPELQGKIGVLKGSADLIPQAQQYLGLPFCSEDPKELQQVLDLLLRQKPHVRVYGGGAAMREQMVSGELGMTMNYSGQAIRGRRAKSTIEYQYPKEGVQSWQDVIMVPIGSRHIENARKFINFTLDPKVAAMISNHAGFSNGVKGGTKDMNEELRTAPEINVPSGIPIRPTEACSPKATELQDKVVTKLLE